ncbi:hypothetical protein VTK73DRAFT_3580 [Phialemonium thermophilum]|uniref:Protein kinase domain-containing protein n=1 Tax=Phialemonium thermophilum TaxID=223376 RepID=A0ABR3VHH7_9PEZI
MALLAASPRARRSLPDPYTPGSTLVVDAVFGTEREPHKSQLRLGIRQRREPWTLSCGLVVEILDDDDDDDDDNDDDDNDDDDGKSTPFHDETPPTAAQLGDGRVAFLKLFDRRFVHQLRRDVGLEPWSDQIEQALQEGVRTGRIAAFLRRLHGDAQFREATQDEWDAAESEAFLDAELAGLFANEVATYAALRRCQGQVVPRLLAQITLDMGASRPPNPSPPVEDAPILPTSASTRPPPPPLQTVRGLLLDYLPGFTLTSLTRHVPESAWQRTVDQALRLVHVLGDHDILNRDVRPDNFVVVPPQRGGRDDYRVFMVDFGHCRRRRPDESDADWGKAKWRQNEEGAVGAVMQHFLRRTACFELVYEPSWRYLEWAPEHDEEDE